MKNITRIILLIAAITFVSPRFSFGQDARILSDKIKELNHETLDDAYLPNEYSNKKIAPPYKYKSTVAPKLMNTTIFTNQANVNSSGQNILGDAANEPNIAVNPLDENKIVIGWRQFDNVSSNFRQAGWSYTSDAGQTWTFPGTIDPGVFHSDPVLDYDSLGNFYYNSLNLSFVCKVYESTNGGSTWDNGTAAGGGDKQWMTIDRTTGEGSGNIYCAWSPYYTSCSPGFFTRSTDDGNSFENCTEVDGDSYWGTMAVGNDGELFITGTDTTANTLVAKSVNAKIQGSIVSWNTVTVDMDGYLNYGATVNPGGLLGQANIDVDRSNGPGKDNVYVLASVTRLSIFDPGDVMFAKSTDGGLTWSSPMRINTDVSVTNTQWLGIMSVAPNGRIDAVWLDNRDAPGSDSSALYYSYSIDEGNTWSVNEKLSDLFDPHVGYPNQNKIGDYFDMLSDNTGAHLAWANTLNGEEDVYYSHIIPGVASGGNEVADNTSFSIYPNPSSGVFIIAGLEKESHIEICNALGEKLFSKTIIEAKSEIDISTQPAGIYFLKIINEDGSMEVKKIIRE